MLTLVTSFQDPASLNGPRGFIPVLPSPVFNIGMVQPKGISFSEGNAVFIFFPDWSKKMTL
jgi:hypothetical protein